MKVNKVYINEEKTIIKMDTDKGDYYLTAVDDCCSTTWFEHCFNIEALIGQEIPDPTIRSGKYESIFPDQFKQFPKAYGDVVALYAYEIKTPKGMFELEFRNESNGCYGGSLHASFGVPYEQYGNAVDLKKHKFKELTEDF